MIVQSGLCCGSGLVYNCNGWYWYNHMYTWKLPCLLQTDIIITDVHGIIRAGMFSIWWWQPDWIRVHIHGNILCLGTSHCQIVGRVKWVKIVMISCGVTWHGCLRTLNSINNNITAKFRFGKSLILGGEMLNHKLERTNFSEALVVTTLKYPTFVDNLITEDSGQSQ